MPKVPSGILVTSVSTVELQYIAEFRVRNPETAIWSERDMYEYKATLTKTELHVFTCYVCECPVSAKLILLLYFVLCCFASINL